MTRYAMTAILALCASGCWFDHVSDPYTYPRLALGRGQICRIPMSELPDLARYDLIYGSSASNALVKWRADVRDMGYGDWEDRVVLIQVLCPYNAPLERPAQWEYDLWKENPQAAVSVAAYENLKAGCDWYLRDTSGKGFAIWKGTPQAYMLNTGPACPKGVWGPTKGLTFIEYLCGPWLDAFGGKWRQAWDGVQWEESPDAVSCWISSIQSARVVPGPGRAPMTCSQFQQFAQQHADQVYSKCVLELSKRGIITRINGHFALRECPSWGLAPRLHAAFVACKMEQVGNWGGCPAWDAPSWARAYMALESLYHPLSPTEPVERSAWDRLQGWDMSTMECMPLPKWGATERDRWERLYLGLTLMGDGTFSLAWTGDQYGHQGLGPVPRIRELDYELGEALGGYAEYIDQTAPGMPVYYRCFERGSVVVNPWGQQIAGIAKQDAVWFKGLWPGSRERIGE